jgi:hypothetical protein
VTLGVAVGSSEVVANVVVRLLVIDGFIGLSEFEVERGEFDEVVWPMGEVAPTNGNADG